MERRMRRQRLDFHPHEATLELLAPARQSFALGQVAGREPDRREIGGDPYRSRVAHDVTDQSVAMGQAAVAGYIALISFHAVGVTPKRTSIAQSGRAAHVERRNQPHPLGVR
jgi:hypothetical protein